MRGNRFAVSVVILLVVIGAGIAVLRRPPRGPKLLNQPTPAREVRPLTTRPDERFAPLPILPEKHGK